MSRSSTVLFWFMLAAGFTTLAPCLILPAWIEYREALALMAARQERLAACEAQLKSGRKQIEHLQNDAAYIERIARQELNLPIPGVKTVIVETPSGDAGTDGLQTESAAGPTTAQTELFPHLSEVLTAGMRLYPAWMRLFLVDGTRWVLMGLSGAMLLSSVLLLGRRPAARQRLLADAAQTPTVVTD